MVQAMQRAACAELLELASERAPAATPSLFGGSLEAYQVREGTRLPSSEKLEQLWEHTKATRKAKREQAARPAGAPIPLQGPRAGRAAQSPAAKGFLARCRQRRGRVAVFVVRGTLPERMASRHFAVLQDIASAPAAHLFAVPSTEDLDRAPLPPLELQAWLHIVALGKPAVPMGALQPDTRPTSPECLGHAASARRRAEELVLTERFVQRFGRLAVALEDLAAKPWSKWRVERTSSVASRLLAEPAAANRPRVLDTKDDFQLFLRAVRMFARSRGAHGTYSKGAVAKSEPPRCAGVAARTR